MSSKAHERFNIETTPYVTLSILAATDGTTTAQQIGGNPVWQTRNTGVSSTNMFAEPEQQSNNSQEDIRLDKLSRLLLYIARSGSSGPAWSYTFDITRSTVASPGVTTSSGTIIPNALAAIIAIDNPMDSEFGKSSGVSAITDVVQGKLIVTPGSAVVETISLFAILVPGFVDGTSNKGANLSAPQYLTYR